MSMIHRVLCLIFLIITRSTECPEKNSTIPTTVTDQEYDTIIFDWSRTWSEVMQLVKQKHYKITNPQEGMSRAIDAFLNNLDAHSNFLDQKTYKSMIETTSGEFYGIGIVIDNTRKTKDKFLTIVDILPDGPADKANLQQYDKIVEANGKPLEGLSTEEIIALLKGERGSQVTIKVLREGQQDLLTFTLTRDVVKEQTSLSFYIKNYNICYLSLTMFTDTAAKIIQQLLEKGTQLNYKGLILDLRNNSGGLLNSVIDIAGLFLEKGSLVVVTKDKHNKEIDRYITTRVPVHAHLPIFILINNFTASAGEILAGCLKIHAEQTKTGNNLVFLVGTTTFGKGSVQEVIPVSNNSAVKLTTSLYFLPDHSTIQGIGIVPDFTVERCLPPTEQMQWFVKNYGRESNLDHYIQVVETVKKEEPKKPEEKKDASVRWLERAKEMLQNDNQLRAAITLANILDTARKNAPDTVKTRSAARTYLEQNYLGAQVMEIEEIKV
jgi:carboxyl-terminal processing protease